MFPFDAIVDLFSRHPNPKKKRDRYRHLAIEVLEIRIVPTTFEVDTTDDTNDSNLGDGLAEDANGNTSLRAAVQEGNHANSGANVTIDFCLPADSTISLDGALPDLEKNYTINGSGYDDLTIERSGTAGFLRVFKIIADRTVNINNVTIANGAIQGDGVAGKGGGIYNAGTLNLYYVYISGNSAIHGGGIANASSAVLTLESCGVYSNEVTHHGGGILNEGLAYIQDGTEIALNDATRNGGGVANTTGASVTVDTGSSIYANVSVLFGAGVYNAGTLSMSSATLSTNQSSIRGGGLHNEAGTATLTSVSITSNSVLINGNGGGIFVQPGSTVTLAGGCTVSGNTVGAGGSGPDVHGNITSQGANTIGIGATRGSISILADSLLTVSEDYTQEEDTDLAFELTTPEAGSGKLVVGGITTLAGTLSLDPLEGFGGDEFTLINGSDDVVGTFEGLDEGDEVAVGGLLYTISYVGGGDDFDVVLTRKNQAPVNTAPSEATTNEDTPLVFSTANGNALSIADADANPATTIMQVRLQTSLTASLTLSGTTGLSFSFSDADGTGSGDGTADQFMVFRGTINAINAALNGLTFTPGANINGNLWVYEFITHDLGNFGAGGTLHDFSDIEITVNSVNDTPTGANNTVYTSQNTDYVFSTSDFGFSDGIDGNGLLAVKITSLPSIGTLLWYNGSSWVAVSANQFISASDIASNNLKYVPPANSTGSPTFGFRVQDDGGTDDGGIDLDITDRTMTINIS